MTTNSSAWSEDFLDAQGEEYWQSGESEHDVELEYNEYVLDTINAIENEINSSLEVINLLQDKCLATDESIIKKSLILAAFSTVESYIYSITKSFIPSELSSLEYPRLKKFVEKEIQRNLHDKNGREKLRAAFVPTFPNEPNIPYKNIRNSLAHNISVGEVSGDDIIIPSDFSSSDQSQQKTKITKIFNDLKKVLSNYDDHLDELLKLKE